MLENLSGGDDSRSDSSPDLHNLNNGKDSSVFRSFMNTSSEGEGSSLLGSRQSSSSDSSEPRLFSSYNDENYQPISFDSVGLNGAPISNTLSDSEKVNNSDSSELPGAPDTKEDSNVTTSSEEPASPLRPIWESAPLPTEEEIALDSTSSSPSDELSSEQEPVFPLFLSFKANENGGSISDVLKERNEKQVSTSLDTSETLTEPLTSSLVSADSIEDVSSDDLSSISPRDEDIPIFKPLNTIEESDIEAVTDNVTQSEVKLPTANEPPVFLANDKADKSGSTQEEERKLDFPPVYALNRPSEAPVSSLNTNKNPVSRGSVPQEKPIFAPPAAAVDVTPAAAASSVTVSEPFAEHVAPATAAETRKAASPRVAPSQPASSPVSRSASGKSAPSSAKASRSAVDARPGSSEEDKDAATLPVRPGGRYSAAQQMGNVAPIAPRDTKKKKQKRDHHKLLIFLLIDVAVLVIFFSVWNYFDLGKVIFGEAQAVPPTFSTTLSTAVSTTAESGNAAGNETAKTTLTPTPSTQETTTVATSKETTAATSKETTAATTTETTAATTTESTNEPNATSAVVKEPAKIPSGFSSSIENGKSSGDTGSFSIALKNTGGKDVSLYDGVEYLQIVFNTSATITSVTSDDFTFVPKPGKPNTFIGTPTSTDTIPFRGTATIDIEAKTDGADIGKFTIKYFIKCYE